MSLLNKFFLVTYADLKKYKYYYWFAFLAFVSKPAWEIGGNGWKPADVEFGAEAVCITSHSALIQALMYFLCVAENYSWAITIRVTAVLLGSPSWEFSRNRSCGGVVLRQRAILIGKSKPFSHRSKHQLTCPLFQIIQ